uniref:NusB domain-containing protein n=1 Tax=Steinernema glaseri TaxID=37863 RepID=A0A1I7ZUB6_9BILA
MGKQDGSTFSDKQLIKLVFQALAWEITLNSKGLQQTKDLARDHCYNAASLASHLPNGNRVGDALVELALSQLDREK